MNVALIIAPTKALLLGWDVKGGRTLAGERKKEAAPTYQCLVAGSSEASARGQGITISGVIF